MNKLIESLIHPLQETDKGFMLLDAVSTRARGTELAANRQKIHQEQNSQNSARLTKRVSLLIRSESVFPSADSCLEYCC
jgi:hypothetical protein